MPIAAKGAVNGDDLQHLPEGYIIFFKLFNEQQYFQAHEVLEEVWLGKRSEPIADFYQGLILLAGAFVHLQKDRLRPAVSLFRLAQANLARFPDIFQRFDLLKARQLITDWSSEIERNGFARNPCCVWPKPQLWLEE